MFDIEKSLLGMTCPYFQLMKNYFKTLKFTSNWEMRKLL